MSIIPFKLKEETYIRFYFNTKKGLLHSGIRRAYLDLNRTLPLKVDEKVESETERIVFRDMVESLIQSELEILKSNNYSNQKEFDSDIERIIKSLLSIWPKLSIGQSQKWINMTLKYWLLFGDERVVDIEKNARYFHIPIDSIIQKKCFRNWENSPWSKIRDYESYFNYQLGFRSLYGEEFGILKEMEMFNKS